MPIAVAPRIVKLLRLAGKLIGEAGTDPSIRVIRGGQADAEDLFRRLAEGATPLLGSKYPGELVELPGGVRIGFRPRSTSGPATIDVHGVEGLGIREIKFLPRRGA